MSLTRKDPKCFGCLKYKINGNEEPNENEVKFLKTCMGCKIVKYCSKECQKQNWKSHKEACQYVAKLTKEIEDLENNHKNLKNRRVVKINDIHNLQEEHPGPIALTWLEKGIIHKPRGQLRGRGVNQMIIL